MKREEILKEILERKAVAVIRVQEAEKLRKVIEAIYSGGISSAEITMTVPNAIQLIEKMTEQLKQQYFDWCRINTKCLNGRRCHKSRG